MSPAPAPSPAVDLVLGTAQFGLDYGIANEGGAPAADEAAAILSLARSAGIGVLDTAVAYGESESRLGLLGVEGFGVMTKLPAVPPGCSDVRAWVAAQVDASLSRLRVERLAALSLHRPAQLHAPVGLALVEALRGLRADPRVQAIGASIASPDELPALLASFDFDLVQAPYNLFDRRIIASGWGARLRERGCRLHLRSCFLQGLLLLPPARRPPWSARWAPLFEAYDRWLSTQELDPLTACLRFARAAPDREKLVLGVDSTAQLAAILAVSAAPLPDVPDELACDDPDLVNPARWPMKKE